MKYLSSASLFEPWEPIHATVGETPYAELVVSIKGGGKVLKPDKQQKKTRKTVIDEKKGFLEECAKTANVSMSDTVGEMVEMAKRSLSDLYTKADTDATGVLRALLNSVPTEMLGDNKDTSPLMKAYRDAHGDYRIQAVGDIVMRANYGRLCDLHAEIGGLVETCELTWDIIINQCFLRADTAFDWQSLKRCIEDAILIRASRGN